MNYMYSSSSGNMTRYSTGDGSVQALKKELEEERLKSMKVEDMFKELCGELGFEGRTGETSEAEEPTEVPPTSPDPKRSLSPPISSPPPTPPTGNRISSLFSTLGAPSYSDRSNNITDGVITAPGASPHFSVPLASVYPDVKEDVFAPEPAPLDIIPKPESLPRQNERIEGLPTSPVVRSASITSDPPTTSLPIISGSGGRGGNLLSTQQVGYSNQQQRTSAPHQHGGSQLQYYSLQPSSPVPRVSTSEIGTSANPPSLQGARNSITSGRSSYVSSASTVPTLQGRVAKEPLATQTQTQTQTSRMAIQTSTPSSDYDTARNPQQSKTLHTPQRIVTPATASTTAASKETTVGNEEEINNWITEGISPIKVLGPMLSRVFDEVLASGSLANNPVILQYKAAEQLRKQDWKESVTGLINSQRFLSPFLNENNILFKQQLQSGGLSLIKKHGTSLRCVISGPKDCGKSTYLHVISRVLIEELLSTNTRDKVLIIPIDWDIYLGSSSIDLGVIYCQLVSHFIDCLVAQVPSLRRWKSQLASYWKKVVTQSRMPSLPSDFIQTYEQVAVTWRALCGSLQAAFSNFEYENFISLFMSVPDTFSKCFDFEETMWLVDNFVSLETLISSDGKGSAAPAGLTLQSGMMNSLRYLNSFCILTSEDESHVYNLTGKIAAPVQGVVSQSELTRLFPGLPSVVRCNGKEYGVSVFCGCPGYLVPFVKLFEASIPSQKAEDGIQRSVEFYGSDVETLLERLAQISWERGS